MVASDIGGTYPVTPIRLPIGEPAPHGCNCKWDYDVNRRIKWVKFLAQGCPIKAHATAWYEAQNLEAVISQISVGSERKRGDRGKDKNPRKRPEEKSALI